MPSDQVQEVGGKPSLGINPKYTAKDLRFLSVAFLRLCVIILFSGAFSAAPGAVSGDGIYNQELPPGGVLGGALGIRISMHFRCRDGEPLIHHLDSLAADSLVEDVVSFAERYQNDRERRQFLESFMYFLIVEFRDCEEGDISEEGYWQRLAQLGYDEETVQMMLEDSGSFE